MLKKFMRDPYYLAKYYLLNFVIYSLACVALYKFGSPFTDQSFSMILVLGIIPLALPSFFAIIGSGVAVMGFLIALNPTQLSWIYWALIPSGVYLGAISAYLMHNAVHGSVRPVWLNRMCGEICGLHQLMGFPGWAVSHLIHHRFPDDPKRDPHPPENRPFWQFMGEMGSLMSRVMTDNYFSTWGRAPRYKKIWKFVQVFAPINRYLRALFLLLLLGPMGFVFFYIPSKLFNVFIYAHFNYVTHRPRGKNQSEVLNLNHNFLYKFLNIITAGSYFHKNHHIKPHLFNPSRMKNSNDAPLISYTKPTAAESIDALIQTLLKEAPKMKKEGRV